MGAQTTTVVCCSLFIAILLTKGDAQSLSCDSNITQPLCPGTITKCTCASGGTTTQWRFTTLNVCPDKFNIISLTQLAPCSSSSSSGTCGAYLSVSTNSPSQAGSACTSSTLNITANQALNGLTIECRDVSSGAPGTLIGTGNINIAAPPSAPTIASLISTYSDQRTVTVTWTSVPTATSYNVSINASGNTPYTIPSTGAPQYMKNFTGLTNNTVYTVSVVAINCAGSSSTVLNTNNMGVGPAGPSTTVAASSATPASTPPPSSSNSIALGVGIGVGVGVPIVLAVILVIVGVVYCKGGNTRSKIRNERASPDAGSPDHKGPSKPPRAKQTSPSGGEAPKPAAKPKEALMYADVGTKSNGNKSAQPPANKKYDDGVAYSDIKH